MRTANLTLQQRVECYHALIFCFAVVWCVGLGCLIIATGIPVYVVCVKWKSKPKSFNRLVGRS